ncbi:MAG TPA: M56 family metallopeptidase, partial [Pirellulales bacterium]|nr:M56 family metallopeptidase [Pirellulales bacterium]
MDSASSLHPISNGLGSWGAIDSDRGAALGPFGQPSDSHQPQPATSPPTLAGLARRPDSPPINVIANASAATASSRLPWSALLFGLWGIGAAVQGLLLGYSAILARQLARRAEPLTEDRFQRALDDLRQRLSLHRHVRLLKTNQTCLPIVIGAICPRILLPADCGKWTAERIWMVLSHELAHIQRNDVLWQLVARMAAAVYWFHPLVWLAVRRMRHERERACDDRVLLVGVEATDYATGLVEVAAALRGRRLHMAAGIAMAQRSQLEDRVRSILDASLKRGPESARVRRGILLGATCLVLALGLVRPFSPIVGGAAENGPSDKAAEVKPLESKPNEVTPTESKPAAATLAEPKLAQAKPADAAPPADKPDFDDDGNQRTRGSMRVRVVDFDGKSLGGTKIHASVLTKDKEFKSNRDYESDANGQANIELPSTLYLLRLWAAKHGYVSGFQGWENNPPAGRKLVPEEFTFSMQTGTVMGGTVVDDQGQPIADAKLVVSTNRDKLLAYGDDLNTDAQGRWKLENVPPGDDFEVRVIASHPDFISLHSYYDMGLEKPLRMKELRTQQARIVMQRGIRLTGTITDPEGKPIAGALAIWGDRPYWEHKPRQEVRTDDQGVYRLPPLPPGPMRVTVVAKGWMPEMRRIEIAPNIAPLDFQLKAGKTLRIRLVDNDGAPITQGYFRIENWRGAQSLYNDDHSNVINSQIPRHPDKDGIYEWTWAPDDAVTFRVSAIGDFSAPEVSFTANDQEQVFKLLPHLRIGGSVADAKTGRP